MSDQPSSTRTRFEGKTIIVTGAGSGIGEACVRRLVAEGASVVAVDQNKANVERVAVECKDSERIVAETLDVTDRAQVEKVVASAQRHFGNLFGLVNSAGIRGVGNILDFEPEAWRRVMAVNLEGTFNVCQFFCRALKEVNAPGSVVNVSSGAGVMGVPNRLAYSASKFGVSGLTQTMAGELGAFGIRVNAVAPGMIRTPMTAPMFQDPENVKRIRAAHPIGREGEAPEVAAAILFLLSEDASFITGAVIPVDGGQTACMPSH